MTDEELEKEAKEYLENFTDCANCKERWGGCADSLDEYCLVNNACYASPKQKDIYIAAAEPREKRIADLEKGNAELKDKLNNLASVAEVRLANWQKYEKENAELKAQIEKMSERIEMLEGYERIVKKLQDNGFDTFMSIKEFCKEKIQLDKENAELKEKLEHRNCVDCSNRGSNIKLLKAKEIIKELSNTLDNLYITGLSDKQLAVFDIEQLQDKAERFLED